jgi:H+/Cl- antiporter ClcA
MRPFLPQSKVNFPVLFKLMVIYGVVALIILLCVVLLDFLIPQLDYYRDYYKFYGKSGTMESFREDFWGMDSNFMKVIGELPLLSILAPFGAGGVFGVIHYIFVRKRRSIIQTIEESLESEVDSK